MQDSASIGNQQVASVVCRECLRAASIIVYQSMNGQRLTGMIQMIDSQAVKWLGASYCSKDCTKLRGKADCLNEKVVFASLSWL